MSLEQVQELLPLLLPILLIDLGLKIYAIIDLIQEDRRVKGNNKIIWILVIAFVNIFGWVIYFLAGREE
jgi:hypothetical protein